MKEFFLEDKAQVSAELIIVLAAVVALTLLFVMNIKNFSEKGAKAASQKFEAVYAEINKIGD